MATTQTQRAVPDLAARPSSASHARRGCLDLVDRAVQAVNATAGWLFSSNGRGDLVAVMGERELPPFLEIPVHQAARECQGQVRPVVFELEGPGALPSSVCTAISLVVDGEQVGALTLVVPGTIGAVGAYIERLGPVIALLSVSVDRWRALQALEQRGDELSALRQQLDAFAMDFRSTFVAERARSEQLLKTLGELERTYRATVGGLALAVEAKDERTGGHLYRVSRYGMLVTAVVAPEHAQDPQFEYGFLLHDVGKLMVPDDVLNKPGALTEQEWAIMRLHPEKGRSILEGIDFLEGAREIVYAHHERWDGNGYPRRLRGEEIPLGALIFPLCDAFDAMTSDRPYRSAWPINKALDEICNGAGSQFWQDAVDAFMSLPRQSIQEIMHERRCTQP